MRKLPYLYVAVLSFVLLTACSDSGSENPDPDSETQTDTLGDASGTTDTLGDTSNSSDIDAVDLDAAPGPDVCVPYCGDRNCGDDGCGGNCGNCIDNMLCFGGHCCMPQCDLKECGDDGCGGTCGSCEGYDSCIRGQCCEPSCAGLDCGSDGCGGYCGYCEVSELCLDGICESDRDDDGVPDDADRWRNDPDMPGVVDAEAVYAHSGTTLYTMNVKSYLLNEVGDFSFQESGRHYVTDIAIDQYGVLYAVSYEDLYTCHPETTECTFLGELPASFNGMTMVPRGYLDPFEDVLVGIADDGGWFRLDIGDGDVRATRLGEYGGPYISSGDAYSIRDVGTFASVHKEDSDCDYIVEINPSNGEVLAEIAPTEGYNSIFGLAGWTGHAFAFDKDGDILVVDTLTGDVSLIEQTEISWWGAGVRTIIRN